MQSSRLPRPGNSAKLRGWRLKCQFRGEKGGRLPGRRACAACVHRRGSLDPAVTACTAVHSGRPTPRTPPAPVGPAATRVPCGCAARYSTGWSADTECHTACGCPVQVGWVHAVPANSLVFLGRRLARLLAGQLLAVFVLAVQGLPSPRGTTPTYTTQPAPASVGVVHLHASLAQFQAPATESRHATPVEVSHAANAREAGFSLGQFAQARRR